MTMKTTKTTTMVMTTTLRVKTNPPRDVVAVAKVVPLTVVLPVKNDSCSSHVVDQFSRWKHM